MTALVVLPGLDGTATLHSKFLASVAHAFDTVAVVPYPSDELLDYPALETLVRDSLPPTGPVVVLGESFSGPVALSIAANPPPNLVGLVLSTTFAKSPVPLSAFLAAFARFAPVRVLPFPLLSWLLFGRWADPQLEASLRDALQTVSPDVIRFRMKTAMQADASASLGAIVVPVLYLRATQDRLLSTAASQQIFSSIPQCNTVDIAGPHLLLQTAPEECARAVGDFAKHLG
jgi:pimeloyl-ACP methyl ester carboxylesterase